MVAVAAVGVGPVSPGRSRPFAYPVAYGRIVGTIEEVAADLGVPADQVAGAVTATGLEAWGCNARGERVWRAREVRALFGVDPPPRHRGAPQFRMTIPGSRGRRSRQEPAGLLGDGNAAGVVPEAATGQEWALELEEGTA